VLGLAGTGDPQWFHIGFILLIGTVQYGWGPILIGQGGPGLHGENTPEGPKSLHDSSVIVHSACGCIEFRLMKDLCPMLFCYASGYRSE
jgi:hypothetical protein